MSALLPDEIKSSEEYGWLVVARLEYESLRRHGYAGPMEDGELFWVLSRDPVSGATCLWRNVSIECSPE
jgi:hypothetical protein